jgi:hypothetical protein
MPMPLRSVARWLRIATMAWLVAGVACGIGARVAMRIVALTDSTPGTVLTVGGTVAILVISLIATAPITLVFMALRRTIAGSPFRRGFLFSAGLLGVVGPPFFLLTSGEIGGLGIPALNAAMFGSLFLLWGITTSLTIHRLESRTRAPATRGLQALDPNRLEEPARRPA